MECLYFCLHTLCELKEMCRFNIMTREYKYVSRPKLYWLTPSSLSW